MKNAEDISALKAVSQSLMHENLSVTDGVYGILSDLDVRKQITMLGKNAVTNSGKKDLIIMLKQLLQEFEADSR